MHVLIVGGSGRVGKLVLPILAQHHTLRVFDLRPPDFADADYFAGNILDFDAISRAMEGMDALLYMAMGTTIEWERIEGASTAYDTSVKGLYFALRAAHEQGISHAVYTSSMSVYEDLAQRYFSDEELMPDARHFYGFTKWLGELVCRNAAREWAMTVNVLRLCLPT